MLLHLYSTLLGTITEITENSCVTREAMYIKRNPQALSCNHFCSGKAMSVTRRECVCVCVSVGILQAIRMHHIVICILFRTTAFVHMNS